MGIHKVFIAVNPSMADFYEGFLFFDRLKENVQDKYDFANGAPAVGLVGDFDKIFKTMEKEYNSKKSNKNLFAFFILKESTQFKFPIRDFYKTMDPIMTPDLIEHFFVHKSDVLAQLSPNELLYLSQLYPYNIIKNIKPLSLYSHKKIKFRNSRFLSSINCSIINDKYKVFDLSLFGLRVGGKKPLNISDEILINVEIAHNRNLTLIGIIKWIDKNNNQYGVELKKTVSQSWLEYVKYIESDFFKLQTSEYKAA